MSRRRRRLLAAYARRGEIVSVLANESPVCAQLSGRALPRRAIPRGDGSVRFVKKLGSGSYATVWLVKIAGFGETAYAAKVSREPVALETAAVAAASTVGAYAARVEAATGIDKTVTVNLNGGNSNRIIRAGDRVVKPTFAVKCLTSETETFSHHTAIPGALVVPAGSYLCDTEFFVEYLLGLLCAGLARKPVNGVKSINFSDVFDLSSCPATWKKVFVFQQLIAGSLDSKGSPLRKATIRTGALPEADFGALAIQVLHAIACYQRAFTMSHNDLHVENIMFAKTPAVWAGKRVRGAAFFEYAIDGARFYIPAPQNVVKIGDFGMSAKFQPPIVMSRYTATGEENPDKDIVPNFFSAAYDVGSALASMHELGRHSRVLTLCLCFFVGGFRGAEFQRRLAGGDLFQPAVTQWAARYVDSMRSTFFEPRYGRPRLDMLKRPPLNTMTPADVLKSDIFAAYRARPQTGRIVRVGVC